MRGLVRLFRTLIWNNFGHCAGCIRRSFFAAIASIALLSTLHFLNIPSLQLLRFPWSWHSRFYGSLTLSFSLSG